MKQNQSIILFVFFAVFLVCDSSQATVLKYDFILEFSGADDPVGPVPWMIATVSDETAGQVDLTLEATGLSNDEFVKTWYFNLNPDFVLPGNFDPADPFDYSEDLSQTHTTSVTYDEDNMKADGDSAGYDFLIEFDQAAGANRFAASESYSIIFYSDALTAFDFNVGNGDSSKGGPFVMASHVGGIGIEGDDNDGSGWLAAPPTEEPIPEPATILLFGTGLAGLSAFRYRTKKK